MTIDRREFLAAAAGLGSQLVSTSRVILIATRYIIERFRRPDFGHMEVQVTIDDPKTYKKPWTARIGWDFNARHGPSRLGL